MALGDPISIRLSAEKHFHYEDEAMRLNKPFGTYLRERLEADDTMRDELNTLRQEVGIGLSAIRQALEDAATQSESAAIERAPTAVANANALLLEMLLLLREIGGPERMKRTHAELLRQGLKPWTPS